MKPYIIRRIIASLRCILGCFCVSYLVYLEVIYAVERYSGSMRRG